MLDVAIHRSIGSAMADGATVCQLRGELVSREASVVRALRGRLAHARTLLVDLRGVAAFDRPGLGALVGVLRSAHPGTGRSSIWTGRPPGPTPTRPRRPRPPATAWRQRRPGTGCTRG